MTVAMANTAVSGTDDTERKSPKAPRSKRTYGIQLARLAVLAAILLIWQVASGRWIDDFLVSSPSQIFPQLWEWLSDGTVWYHFRSTISTAAIGFALGGSIAVVVGYILGQSPRLAAVVEPFITSLYSMPKLALVPLFIMWFGIGTNLQVAISGLITFFLMFYSTFFGIRDVDEGLVDQVRVMGGRQRDLALRVRLPSALVWVVAGLKISIPQAIVGVVVAEILAGQRGLGYLVAHSANQFDAEGTFAALFVLLALGFVVDRFVGLVTRRALAWKTANDVTGRP